MRNPVKLLLLCAIICNSYLPAKATSLKDLFKNQDYDEIVAILNKKSDLSAEEKFYLGFSLYMRGKYKKGFSLIEKSFVEKPNALAGEFLSRIYFTEGKYKEVIKISEKVNNGKLKELAEKSEKILNEKEKPIYKTETTKIGNINTAISLVYDSNPLFFPEETSSSVKNSYATETLINYRAIKPNYGYSVTTFASIQLNRNNKFLDFFTSQLSGKLFKKNLTAEIKGYVTYINNGIYTVGSLLGFEKRVAIFNIEGAAGGEKNFENNDKSALILKVKAETEKFKSNITFKKYRNFPDRTTVTTQYTTYFSKLTVKPFLKTRFYSDGSRNIVPGGKISFSEKLPKNFYFSSQFTYEKGFGSGELENDYNRYTASITVKKSF